MSQSYRNQRAHFAMDPQGNRFLLVVNPNRSSERTEAPIPLTVVVNWAQTLVKK